ncbi:hypothetical protein FRB94_009280 [Tulasnella sp. JGI-2019a]|nr:hypothetical protein FRB94_009280 [Tulasnella sp. JGI-2019a]KAG9000139.1 hypothetical protein FRB93_012814 [Tulasnella sp. JGI-2019a]
MLTDDEERLPRVRFLRPRQEIIPGLWLGDWLSAHNYESLKEDNIFYVLSVVDEDDLAIDPRLMRHHINIDDDESSDLLIHLPPAIAFIQKALESGQGILVHCAAGISAHICTYKSFKKKLLLT